MPTHVPKFDIFRGHFPDKDAEWLEAVEGLAAAVSRMKEIAAKTPAAYFVFDVHQHVVLATADAEPPESERPSRNEGAA